MKKPLTVYKASAGSGKTYTLAVEYIKLLIKNPQSYSNILAVTFTNKATEEMKMRILSQLYGIWKRLPDSDSYLKKITRELDVSEEYASEQAGIALTYLIHNYNYFRVETIDSFFQNVLRNLARELDLTANLRVSLNDLQVEQEAVNTLIEELRYDSKILSWIMSLIREKMDENKSWNILGEITDFGRNIFKDVYKTHFVELNKLLTDEKRFNRLVEIIKGAKESAKNKIQRNADVFFETLDKYQLSIENFPHGATGVCGYFIKLKKGVFESDELLKSRVVDAMNNALKWMKKVDQKPDTPIYKAVNDELFPLINETERIRREQYLLYKSADLTLKHIYKLRLLYYIDKKVREINKDANRFLLSDTQTLLHELIDDSDSPFIFEKIGTRLHNIMIDEFQDTSTVQWKNFKVLMNECISHADSQNLIVGDVKQSIYRWRSGDWRLLNNINKEFNNNIFKEESLHTNYRSARNIIDFNNAFFSVASKLEYNQLVEKKVTDAESLLKAYGDVIQDTPSGRTKEGLVHIELLPKEDYKEKMMECIEGNITELIENGVPANKIAILVRSNDTIKEIADYLMKKMPDVKLVSDEAFRIENSQAVQIIILALQFIAYPEDILNRASLVQAYNKYILDNELSNNYLIKNNINDEDTLLKFLPREFAENREELKSMPLADLIEYIYRVFNIKVLKDESAYVCTFFDLTFKFMYETPTDVYTLLNEWNENMHKETIQSDEVDGVRLITIHKSKGLEFDNVIIPFCDWTLEKGGLIWCSPPKDISPFNQLPIIPVNYSEKQMKETIFQEEYNHEHLQNMVDNLNLLYVAFTRACKNLFIYGKRGDARYRSYIIEQSLPLIQQEHLEDCIFEEDPEEKGSSVIFTYGTFAETKTQEEANESKNIFNKKETAIKLFVETFDNKTEFQQSNKSREYISENDDEEKQNTYIKIGNILHGLLASIHTIDDLDKAITQLENEGILETEDITIERIKNLLDKRMKNPTIMDWFSNRWSLYNECSILYIDPETNELMTRRPDRVMTNENETIVVDFKFGSQKSEHFSQVKDYMALLNNMNHKHVKGYLWYVYSNNIIEVK